MVIAPLGGVAVALVLLGTLLPAAAAVAFGVAVFGAEYATFLRASSTVDRWAPVVAALLFLVAELGFRAVERTGAHVEAEARLREVASVSAVVLASAGVGGLLLAAAGGAEAGLGLEAIGALAAVLVVALVVAVVARSRDQPQLEP